jgi:group I intron endonuclease
MGIYKIQNRVSGKFYLGSAVNFYKRFYLHENRLRHGVHRNLHLQRAWDKHGPETFEFVVLERVPCRDELIDAEQRWLDAQRATEHGYNICKIAHSRLGVKARPETRARQSVSATGVRHTDEAKRRMSRSKTGVPKAPRTEQHRANNGASRKGIPLSPQAEEAKRVALRALHADPVRSAQRIAKVRATWVAKREKLRIETAEQALERVHGPGEERLYDHLLKAL